MKTNWAKFNRTYRRVIGDKTLAEALAAWGMAVYYQSDTIAVIVRPEESARFGQRYGVHTYCTWLMEGEGWWYRSLGTLAVVEEHVASTASVSLGYLPSGWTNQILPAQPNR